MTKKLQTSIGKKADHTVAGEFKMQIRQILEEETLTLQERLEYLKLGIAAIDKRMNLRAETRKNALAQIQLDEHNARFNTSVKMESLELAEEAKE